MKRIIFYILIAITLVPSFSYAQYKLLEPLPCVDGTGNDCSGNKPITEINLETYIQYVFKFSIALAAFLAVVMIIVGGFEWMLSETPFKIGEGKKRIQNAIIGLVMVLASYLILETIDPRLVQVGVTVPQIRVDTSSLESFARLYVENLEKLAVETRLEVIEMENQKNSIAEELKALEVKKANNQISASEYELQKNKLNQKLNELNVKQQTNISSGLGLIEYKKAVSNIYNADGIDEKTVAGYVTPKTGNTPVNGKFPTNTTNTIQNFYNERINEVKDKDPQKAQLLEKQRDFYVRELDEELKLKRILLQDGMATSNGLYIPSSNHTLNTDHLTTVSKEDELKAKITLYQNNLKDLAKYESIGIPQAQYKEMMEGRIRAIKQAPSMKK
jgi:hypothetical protein